MKKLVVLIALMGSLSGVRAATYIGDLTQTNAVKLTNFVSVVVQKSGTAGTGANGIWMLSTFSNIFTSFGFTNMIGMTNIAAGEVSAYHTTNLVNITNIADGQILTFNATNLANITNIASGEITTLKAAANSWTGTSNVLSGHIWFLGTNTFSDGLDAVTMTNIFYTTDINTNRITNTMVIWNGLIKSWTVTP